MNAKKVADFKKRTNKKKVVAAFTTLKEEKARGQAAATKIQARVRGRNARNARKQAAAAKEAADKAAAAKAKEAARLAREAQEKAEEERLTTSLITTTAKIKAASRAIRAISGLNVNAKKVADFKKRTNKKKVVAAFTTLKEEKARGQAAATKIQARVRGRNARNARKQAAAAKEAADKAAAAKEAADKAAADKAKEAARLAREAQEKAEEEAATTIQATARGRKVRKTLEDEAAKKRAEAEAKEKKIKKIMVSIANNEQYFRLTEKDAIDIIKKELVPLNTELHSSKTINFEKFKNITPNIILNLLKNRNQIINEISKATQPIKTQTFGPGKNSDSVIRKKLEKTENALRCILLYKLIENVIFFYCKDYEKEVFMGLLQYLIEVNNLEFKYARDHLETIVSKIVSDISGKTDFFICHNGTSVNKKKVLEDIKNIIEKELPTIQKNTVVPSGGNKTKSRSKRKARKFNSTLKKTLKFDFN